MPTAWAPSPSHACSLNMLASYISATERWRKLICKHRPQNLHKHSSFSKLARAVAEFVSIGIEKFAATDPALHWTSDVQGLGRARSKVTALSARAPCWLSRLIRLRSFSLWITSELVHLAFVLALPRTSSSTRSIPTIKVRDKKNQHPRTHFQGAASLSANRASRNAKSAHLHQESAHPSRLALNLLGDLSKNKFKGFTAAEAARLRIGLREEDLESLCKQLVDTAESLTQGYIWQSESFTLKSSIQQRQPWLKGQSTAGSACCWGQTSFGDNIEDEWLIAWLLLHLTRQNSHISARIWDTDGEFLLIEAAFALPA